MACGESECANDLFLSCIHTLSNHSFSIGLMSVSIRNFDVIFDIYRLSPDRADMLCYEKAILLNLLFDKTLMIHGNRLSSNLHIISYIKAQWFSRKECQVFLVHAISEKQEVKDL